jgi:hypothetical protein
MKQAAGQSFKNNYDGQRYISHDKLKFQVGGYSFKSNQYEMDMPSTAIETLPGEWQCGNWPMRRY